MASMLRSGSGYSVSESSISVGMEPPHMASMEALSDSSLPLAAASSASIVICSITVLLYSSRVTSCFSSALRYMSLRFEYLSCITSRAAMFFLQFTYSISSSRAFMRVSIILLSWRKLSEFSVARTARERALYTPGQSNDCETSRLHLLPNSGLVPHTRLNSTSGSARLFSARISSTVARLAATAAFSSGLEAVM